MRLERPTGISRPQHRAFAALIVVLFLLFPWNSHSGTKSGTTVKTGSKTSEGRKTGGIVGDPSRKRGFDLGYDAGPKAGDEDMAQNKSYAPHLRQEYRQPEQFYRYEYGSRAMFIAGFRQGFLLGYKVARKSANTGQKNRETAGKKMAVARDAP